MFRRLIFDNWTMIFPVISMIAVTVFYTAITWRACRMKKPQVTHLENLPFADTPDHAPRK